VSYAAKFAVKRAPAGIDFAVMPLEGLWWTSDMSTFTIADKSDWIWTAMIMQPEPVTGEIIETAKQRTAAKKSLPPVELLRFERFHEGRAAQVMYRGPYADEGPTIAVLHQFITDQKLKTIIRQPVAAR
jgi:hypothetical protein